MTLVKAISVIQKSGAILVFPIRDRPQIPSLWSSFYPKEEMRWDWSDEGDDRVPRLWHLRTELSTSRKVVYSKWIQDRATFFSVDVFRALMSYVSRLSLDRLHLSRDAASLLEVLEDDSPLASRELKARVEMVGREGGTRFDRAMKELWLRALVVGFGEVEEGGFPSLAVGASRLLFEDLWDESRTLSEAERERTIQEYFDGRPELSRTLTRLKRALAEGK